MSARRACPGFLWLLVSTCVPAHAQTLDTPALTFRQAGYYRIDFDVRAGASGTPNGFVLQWMSRTDFDLFGWPADPADLRIASCTFTGAPTLNPDLRSGTFELGPGDAIGVQVGDLFDETGVRGTHLDPLNPGRYVFRVFAAGGAVAPSAPSAEVFAATSKPECTVGFWKNHPDFWGPCTPIPLGTVSYTKDQLVAILETAVSGNGLVALAHQLIAVKLNVCNGSNPADVLPAIAAADALVGGLVVPPVGAGSLEPAVTSALTETLDRYNNGLLAGVVPCPSATPARPATWSRVKAIYR